MSKRVLITGANGFVGSHIVDALLREGHDVRAMVRTTSDLTFLQDKPVDYVYGSLGDPASLLEAVRNAQWVVHNAGVVSQPNEAGYDKHNTEGTKAVYLAAAEAAPDAERFLFVSSQAAGGPSMDGAPVREEDEPRPVTWYGQSKLRAERWLRGRSELPWTIIRPPSVYGPRDRAFLPLFRMIERGWASQVGRGHQLSLIHVQDLARQVLLQLDSPEAVGEVFNAAPFDPITQEQLALDIARVLGTIPKVFSIPPGLLRGVYPVLYPLLERFGGGKAFRPDKLPELTEKYWNLSGEKARRKLGFEGAIPLPAGIGQTAEWYRWKGWLQTRRDRAKRNSGGKLLTREVAGSKRAYSPDCDLCGLAFDGEVKTRLHYENEDFVVVDCLICRVPMAVLKEHRAAFTEAEKTRLEKTFRDLFGENGAPDWEQRRIPEHAHVHFRSAAGVKPWEARPKG